MSLARRAKRTAKTVIRSVTHPPVTRIRLVRDLRALGVRQGGLVLVHSSLSSLGSVVGGAATVIRALLEAVGSEGTLVLPTHSWDEMEAGGRVFDAGRTRSCVGTITEVFRSWPGVVRSLHPTHSVAALGPLARDLVADHELAATPCGSGTPYSRLLDRDGQIVFLGAGLNANTAFHTIEALVGVPYLLYNAPDQFTIISDDRRSRDVTLYRHRAGIPRRFESFESQLVASGALSIGRVGPARALLLAGAAFRDTMVAAVAADPSFLLIPPLVGSA